MLLVLLVLLEVVPAGRPVDLSVLRITWRAGGGGGTVMYHLSCMYKLAVSKTMKAGVLSPIHL